MQGCSAGVWDEKYRTENGINVGPLSQNFKLELEISAGDRPITRSITFPDLLDLIMQASFSLCSLFVPSQPHPHPFYFFPRHAKILCNYIPLSHFTRLLSPALADNRGIHHTISCRWFL